MRKSITSIILLSSILLLSSAQTRIFPEKPTAWVNDYAGILSRSEAESLNRKLGNYEDSTSIQIFVVTLDETYGAEISGLAAEIGEAWGVGQKGKDNGLIILIYPNERKIFIAPGYGLEEFLPDIAIRKIIEAEITPAFRNGDYYGGLDKATDVIMGLLSGKFTADQYSSSTDGIPVIGIVLLFIILMLVFRSRPGNHKTLIRNIPFWMAIGMLNGSRNSHSGSFGGFSSGSGGFGGFSGGGGGSFGGGGAGGSW